MCDINSIDRRNALTDATHNHGPLDFQTKVMQANGYVSAIVGRVPLDLLNGQDLRCFQPSPEVYIVCLPLYKTAQVCLIN